jgi:hypothetical protein
VNKVHLTILILTSLITARGAVFEYAVTLTGPNEEPVNNSEGIGAGIVNYNDTEHSLQLAVTFTSLTGNTTAAHIHAPTASPFSGTAGVATTTPTFPGFPLGVTAGAYAVHLDLTQESSFNPAFILANGGTPATAEAALAAAMANGQSYLNLHTTAFPGGEIRGFLAPIPEPGTVALLGLGIAGLAFSAWNRKRRTS